ncbi:MAG: hypothetical protein ABFS19_03440 [Thermodesulfobacteriota bacterium]
MKLDTVNLHNIMEKNSHLDSCLERKEEFDIQMDYIDGKASELIEEEKVFSEEGDHPQQLNFK